MKPSFSIHRQLGILLLLIAATICGCKSFGSTMLERNESNNGWQKMRKLRGIPITLKVPTHIRIDIEETYYLTRKSTDQPMTMVDMEPVREIKHNFILGEKIFTVDFKRPAAGTIDSTIDFVEQDGEHQQYFDKIVSTVTDETIAKTTELVNTLGSSLRSGTGTSSSIGSEIANHLVPIKSVVATEVFELDDPMFEQVVADFLQCHLNQCHDCATGIKAADDQAGMSMTQAPMNATPEVETATPEYYVE
ncbi:MAG: hypothetical protein AAFN77_03745 [Planctomycetota bacterium]